MSFVRHWNYRRYYAPNEEVDHKGQRYRCVNPRCAGEPYLEPKTIEDPPIWINGRNITGGQWTHLGPSLPPVIHEKSPDIHPTKVKQQLQTYVIPYISFPFLMDLICDYLWWKGPWAVFVQVAYAEDEFVEPMEVVSVSTRIKKNTKSLGSMYFSMIPSPSLSFGYFGSADIGAVKFQICVFNNAQILVSGTTGSVHVCTAKNEEKKFDISWMEPQESNRKNSYIVSRGEMIGDGNLRVTQFCLDLF
jgi:hypothetical protein